MITTITMRCPLKPMELLGALGRVGKFSCPLKPTLGGVQQQL